jgi:hypothetical protein
MSALDLIHDLNFCPTEDGEAMSGLTLADETVATATETLAEKPQVLAWPCPFLGCEGRIRIYEGGRAGFNLPACHRCGSAFAQSARERASTRARVDKHLI